MSYREEIIGGARLILGDCREVLPTLSGVDAVVTDPPYSSGALHIGGKRASTSAKYTSPSMGHWSQSKSYPEFFGDSSDQMTWLLSARFWMSDCFAASKDGAHIYVFSDWRQIGASIAALQMGFWQYRGIVVWDKGNTARAPLAGLWRHGAEFLLWGARGQPWSVTGGEWLKGIAPVHNVLSHGNVRDKEHVTEKPVDLLEHIIATCSAAAHTILDPFMGSGTTGVACARIKRKFIGIECHEPYFDIACRRIEQAQRQGDLLRDMPPAEDPADARMADMFSGDAG